MKIFTSIAWNAVMATLVLVATSRLQGSDGLIAKDETVEEAGGNPLSEDWQRQMHHNKQTEELAKGPVPLDDSYVDRVRVEREEAGGTAGGTADKTTGGAAPGGAAPGGKDAGKDKDKDKGKANSTAKSLHAPCGTLFTFILLAL